MALKIARVAGCRIIITSSSDENLDKIRILSGVAPVDVLNYAKTSDWHLEATRLNAGLRYDFLSRMAGRLPF
jgi:hypothetical protein